MAVTLTKSKFSNGLQCCKQLWLAVKQPHRATPPNLVQQRIMDQGAAVGQLARQQFPDGQLIEGCAYCHLDTLAMLEVYQFLAQLSVA
jgi:hypothetical protein